MAASVIDRSVNAMIDRLNDMSSRLDLDVRRAKDKANFSESWLDRLQTQSVPDAEKAKDHLMVTSNITKAVDGINLIIYIGTDDKWE